MCIRWGNAYSSSFSVSNGVKQGGNLSPILFDAYMMDELSVSLNSSNIGGHIGNIFLNYLCYADELCLISLSSAGMQKTSARPEVRGSADVAVSLARGTRDS